MEPNSASLQIVADLLRARTGQHLGPGRMWRISGALSGVFREHAISNVDQLVCLLAAPRAEQLARDVVEALLNNETYFFRDKQMFDQLADQVLPQLIERKKASQRLRVWSAGCSSGQELYSLAMLLKGQNEDLDNWQVDLVGTDISQRIVTVAQRGEYSQFEVQRGLTVAQMLTYFEQDTNGWKAQNVLKKMVTFREHNLLDRPPIEAPFDLVLCRNVLLYFDPVTRRRVFDRLHDAIAADGMLMLGAGETVVGQTEKFVPAGDGTGLYMPSNASSALRKRA